MTIEEIWYGRAAAAAAARAALHPVSLLYGAAASLRGAAYDHGLKAIVRAPAPVVSIGGLRVGGAGKTPFVLWLAAELKARGLHPCLVTRGYGGRGDASRPRVLTATDLELTAVEVADLGDETALLALRSGCTVALGRDRASACVQAWRELSAAGQAPDLFLLDDGFQHRRLVRDLDIVLVDGRESAEALLPAGPLREGLGALARADVVVAMGRGASAPAFGSGQAVFCAEAVPGLLVSSVTDRGGEAPESLSGLRVVAVAAIARPERFLADLEGLGARVVATVLRRDHHRYDGGDLREIGGAAVSADLVVTTEKDLVKLTGGARWRERLRALRLAVRVEGGRLLVDRVAALGKVSAAV